MDPVVNKTETNCPCCDRHCPVTALRCGRGRKHFGIPEPPEKSEERVLNLIQRCGRFLHHGDPNIDRMQYVNAIPAEDRAALEALLGKVLESWQALQPEKQDKHKKHS